MCFIAGRQTLCFLPTRNEKGLTQWVAMRGKAGLSLDIITRSKLTHLKH